MERKRTIFLFAGGSGGHIEPALMLKKKLQGRNQNVFLYLATSYPVSDSRNIKKVIICRSKFKFILQFPYVFLYLLTAALIKKPDVFIGFGGYYSIPGILIGSILGAETIIYEPNVIWGRANNWLKRIADYIFVIWPNIKICPRPRMRNKIVAVKPLIKVDVSERDIQNKSGVFSVLITGGSQGSLFLNKLTIDLMRSYDFKEHNVKFTLITGKKFYPLVKNIMSEFLKSQSLNLELFAYRTDLNKLYRGTDLLISRAGAQTLLEAVYYSLPAVFIPYPYAYKHQIENAKHLFKTGACYLLEQETADYKSIGDLIIFLEQNQHLLEQIKSNLKMVKSRLLTAKSFEDLVING